MKHAGRVLATLILGCAGTLAYAQNNAPPGTLSLSSSAAQSLNIDIGERTSRSSSGISIGNRAPQAGGGGQSAASLAPPSVSGTATYGGDAYGGGNGLGYIEVVPQVGMPVHPDGAWAGPVMPDERARQRRRLSTEERLRLRSDIRDASRNMYEHPRGR